MFLLLLFSFFLSIEFDFFVLLHSLSFQVYLFGRSPRACHFFGALSFWHWFYSLLPLFNFFMLTIAVKKKKPKIIDWNSLFQIETKNVLCWYWIHNHMNICNTAKRHCDGVNNVICRKYSFKNGTLYFCVISQFLRIIFFDMLHHGYFYRVRIICFIKEKKNHHIMNALNKVHTFKRKKFICKSYQYFIKDLFTVFAAVAVQQVVNAMFLRYSHTPFFAVSSF